MHSELTFPYPEMPAAQAIVSNGMVFSTHCAGSGLPVLLLHGFPELAYSWRHQIQPLVDAGCQVIVPDLRGYGHTGLHGSLSDYRMHNLACDVVGLLDALGIAQCVVIGHDFGGALAWTLARDHAKRFLGVVALNTPYTRRTEDHLIDTLRKYRGESNYMVYFQKPGQGEALLEANVYATFAGMMCRPNALMRDFSQAPEALQSLPASLLGQDKRIQGVSFLTEQELSVYVKTYEKTGFTGGLNWYRNLARNWQDTQGVADRVELPALMVCAEHDIFLPPATAEGIERYVPLIQRALIRDCGHWTQQERPEEVNALIITWLRERLWL
ncbi:alpha/beta fold hydrolase [Lampropedia puyangensis]|nr:alpha/beta hydrolase [Lampropedia puyangensis]